MLSLLAISYSLPVGPITPGSWSATVGRGDGGAGDGGGKVEVSLKEKRCECGAWKMTGHPCIHALAVWQKLGEETIPYVELFDKRLLAVTGLFSWIDGILFEFPIFFSLTFSSSLFLFSPSLGLNIYNGIGVLPFLDEVTFEATDLQFPMSALQRHPPSPLVAEREENKRPKKKVAIVIVIVIVILPTNDFPPPFFLLPAGIWFSNV